MKNWIKKVWTKTRNWMKQTWKELKDWKTLILYIAVNIVLSVEVWLPYLLAIITGNKWWAGIASACWLFWLGPGTPFTLIAMTLTIAIKKLYLKIKNRRHKDV